MVRYVLLSLCVPVLSACATTPAPPSPARAAVAPQVPNVSAGPAWRSPYECFIDDGNGRYRYCSQLW